MGGDGTITKYYGYNGGGGGGLSTSKNIYFVRGGGGGEVCHGVQTGSGLNVNAGDGLFRWRVNFIYSQKPVFKGYLYIREKVSAAGGGGGSINNV